ncbi:hypothetical protein ABIC02_007842, partial [Bradyrhizobium sp. RT5a]
GNGTRGSHHGLAATAAHLQEAGYICADCIVLINRPCTGGAGHPFFPTRSFSAALSNMASARSRFSFVFSSSSDRSRLASETSIPPNLAFHFVDAGIAVTMLSAEIGDRNPRFVLLQNPDDLFFRKPLALHALVLGLGQNELQTGLSPRGKVTECGRTATSRLTEVATTTVPAGHRQSGGPDQELAK